ncbi:hypothetical protein T484DRAFT_1818933 [Baffinella frigidus]|nr:hypothetical protein T484DRAFT_1818933 [Cryptophyta sp. CCMP2293]
MRVVWLAPILWLGTDAFAWLNASCLDNWTEGTRMRKPQEELPYDFLVLFYTLVGVWGTEKFLKVTHVETLHTLHPEA